MLHSLLSVLSTSTAFTGSRGLVAAAPPSSMAAVNQCLRPPLPPCPRLPFSLYLPAPPAFRRARPTFASWHPPPLALPPSAASPLPKKRASGINRVAAEEDGAVVDEGAEAEEQLEYGDGEYVSSVGTNFSLPARLRAARAAPGGDPVFFLLAAVAVTVRRCANLRSAAVSHDLVSGAGSCGSNL